jgi:AAA family ATP:ADP antiporter
LFPVAFCDLPAVALAEVLRKVLAYSLARPARESLFTVVSREEKYRAKIFLDTVVQVGAGPGC